MRCSQAEVSLSVAIDGHFDCDKDLRLWYGMQQPHQKFCSSCTCDRLTRGEKHNAVVFSRGAKPISGSSGSYTGGQSRLCTTPLRAAARAAAFDAYRG